MQRLKDNFGYIVIAIGAIVLIYFAYRLQNLLQAPSPTVGGESAAVVNTPQVLIPATATALPTPLPPTPTSPPPTATIAVEPTLTTAAEAPTATALPEAAPAGATATQAGYKVYGATLIGAIHVGAITDRGYNQAHHDGLQQAVDQIPGVRLIEVENVPETEEVGAVIDDLVQQGAQIIFVQSFGYLPYALAAADRHPQITFLHPGGFELRPNLGTYWANNFEAMYLAGIAAGAATKSNQLGFITAFPIPNILASVNAFHLGAQSVNPTVTTKLVINESWVNPAKEAAATAALATVGVDVVTMIVDSPITVVQTAEERGISVIGFHSASLQELAPRGWLTGVDYSWGNYYSQVIQQVRAGQWQSAHVRGGIESDMIQLAPFGAAVSEETKNRIVQARGDIIRGQLKIFQGPIKDSLGVERIKTGEAGGVELLDTTDWLVAGVSQFDATTVAIAPAPAGAAQPMATTGATPAASTTISITAPVEAPTSTSQATTQPADTPLPPVDYTLGYVGDRPGCTLVTEIVATLMEQNFKIRVRAVPFATLEELYQAMEQEAIGREESADEQDTDADMTFCHVFPDDVDFLRQHGDLEVVGRGFAQADKKRWHFVIASEHHAVLESKYGCFFQFAKQRLDLGDLQFTEDNAASWIENHADRVREWTTCQ